MNNGAVISSDTAGRGNAGAITIEALDSVAFEGVNPEPPNAGNFISSGVYFGATGNGGDINITTTNLSLKDGSSIQNLNSGQGDAGTITIDASDTITLEGADRSEQIAPSRIGTVVDLRATGNGGEIDITTANLFLKDGALIDASTFGRGDAGTITINASDTITLEGADRSEQIALSRIGTVVDLLATGNGGEIDITTANLFLKDGALIDASTFGQGDAGTITIEAFDTISLEGTNSLGFSSLIVSDTTGGFDPNGVAQVAQGNAGAINLTTNNLFLKEGGQISTFTLAQGDAGAITIEVADTIVIEGDASGLDSGIFSSAEPIPEDVTAEFPEKIAVGNAGDIKITTTSLFLKNGGTVATSSFIEGNAGTITVNASDLISIEGEASDGSNSIIGSTLSSSSGSIGTGDSGKIDITTTNLSLTRGGRINVSSFARGDAGEIIIEAADTIAIDGESSDGTNSGIFSTVGISAEGDGGEIEITSTNLSLTNGGQLSATTFGLGNAGEITINALDTISVDGGGLILATTFGQGDAGNLTVTASESIELVGSDGEFPSGLFANTIEGSGDGGNLTIATDKLIVRDEAVVTVGNFQQVVGNREPLPTGTGAAGNLEINAGSVEVKERGKITADNANGIGGNLTVNADSLTLENEASVSSSTIAEEGQGGIVTLNIDDSLIMSDRSLISARADSGANGGNLTINAESIVAFPNQNNDIIANAARGDGGNIDITTNALFGIAERSPTDITNDIDASSEFGLDGTVAINELDVNPAEALEELPTEVIDVAGLVAQNLCQQGDESEFIVTGKGGIAPNPSQVRDGEFSGVDLVEPATIGKDGEAGEAAGAEEQGNRRVEEIFEAQGWIVNDRGNVELVTHKTDLNGSPPPPQNKSECNAVVANYIYS